MCASALLSSVPLASAHIEMVNPYAIRSKNNPANTANGLADYNMKSPLLADGSNFPCKGYQNDRPIAPVATYSAGSNYTLQLEGSATHNGGSCQLSLSYDNGKTFRVIKSMIGGCPLTLTYGFQIPAFAPSGSALLAWTWVNLSGNREYYMNCAEVAITGGPAAQSQSPNHRRHALRHVNSRRAPASSFDALPYLWKANIPPVNDCKTVESMQVVYPHPGPDVEYGSGVTPASPIFPGTCDAAGPPGPTYKDLPTTGGSGGSSSASASAGTTFSASSKASASTNSVVQKGPPSSSVSVSSISPSSTLKGSVIASIITASPSSKAVSSVSKSASAAVSASAYSTSTSAAALSTTTMSTATTGMAPSQSGTQPGAGSPCDSSGLLCLRNGTGFALCDHGYWHDMGSVAPGTACRDGAIGYAK